MLTCYTDLNPGMLRSRGHSASRAACRLPGLATSNIRNATMGNYDEESRFYLRVPGAQLKTLCQWAVCRCFGRATSNTRSTTMGHLRIRVGGFYLRVPGSQLKTLCQWGGVSLFWSCFKWFFSAGASADARVASCGGFSSWPTFGFKALDLTWNFDGSLTYIGVGTHYSVLQNPAFLYITKGMAAVLGSLIDGWDQGAGPPGKIQLIDLHRCWCAQCRHAQRQPVQKARE